MFILQGVLKQAVPPYILCEDCFFKLLLSMENMCNLTVQFYNLSNLAVKLYNLSTLTDCLTILFVFEINSP